MFQNVLIVVGLLILLQDIYVCSDVDRYEKEVEATEDILVETPLGIGCINQSESLPTCQQGFKPEESEGNSIEPLEDTVEDIEQSVLKRKKKDKKKRKKKDKNKSKVESSVAVGIIEDDVPRDEVESRRFMPT